MNDSLYFVKVTCAVCGCEIDVIKIKSKACRIKSRDSDFCVYYETINPLFYDIWVCDHCGYSAQKDKFENISESDKALIKKYLTPKWNEQKLNVERNINQAITAYKLALASLQVINAEPIDFAKVCVRTGWMYRLKKDKEREIKFLEYSLNAYRDTYNKTSFPIGKMNEGLCIYIIAELARRVDQVEESLKWFAKALVHNDIRSDPKLSELVKEQLYITKERLKILRKEREEQAS